MDIGYIFGGPHWERASLYLPPGLEPPEEIVLLDAESGRPDTYVRLSDRSLSCEKQIVGYGGKGNKTPIYRGCGDWQCHRGATLGICGCGTHNENEARPQRSEVGEPAWEPPLSKETQQRAQSRTLRP